VSSSRIIANPKIFAAMVRRNGICRNFATMSRTQTTASQTNYFMESVKDTKTGKTHEVLSLTEM